MDRRKSAALALSLVACGGATVAPSDAGSTDAPPEATITSDASSFACDCADAAPWGWRWVAFEASKTACPTGWEAPTDLVELRSEPQPATCSCTCGPPTGKQTCTLTSMNFRTHDLSCSGKLVDPTFSISSLCTTASVTVSSPYGFAAWPQVTSAGMTCATNSVVDVPPTDEAAARVCEAPPHVGKCGAGKVCLPPGDVAPFSRCITAASTDLGAACPAGFPQRHVVADSFMDNRSCGAPCICNTFAPCDVLVHVYDDASCSTGDTSIVPTACYPARSIGSFTATTGPSGGVSCGMGYPYPAPEGGVYPKHGAVICCP